MTEHELISLVLFSGFFLFTSSLLHNTTKKISLLPYTSALLLMGILAQILAHQLGIESHISLSPYVIYYILLPLLLFESAMHINLHEFKLQFKTISFLATFGLLSSSIVIGTIMSYALNLPLIIGLLFGTVISATDPIAVLSMFKSLGAPKRLGLLAEGESMFNDATAVITFKTLLTFAITGATIEANHIAFSGLQFVYVTLGSTVVGAVLGYLVAQVIAKINNDRLVETTLTLGLSLTSFVVAEHFFHFSGVISTVVAGIVLGNLGKTKISGGVIEFMSEFWGYISFISISLVFFFATFNLDLEIFTLEMLRNSFLVILIMLFGRALSIYLTFSLTNKLSWFKNEPNVPMSWQHIINWGGMRGVIPLVLVYSLPNEFIYKAEFISYTISAFLFTLFVNAMSIETLLKKLGIHLPKLEESIIRDEEQLMELAEAEKEIRLLTPLGFDPKLITQSINQIKKTQLHYKKDLLKKTPHQTLINSLKLQSIRIERQTIQELFHEGNLSETAFYELETELELQLDALEYPEVSKGRSYQQGGLVSSRVKFERQLRKLHKFAKSSPWLSIILGYTEKDLVIDRISLLKARIISSQEVVEHLRLLQSTFARHKKIKSAIVQIMKEQEKLIKHNQQQLKLLDSQFPKISQKYQNQFILSLITSKTSGGAYDH